MKRLPRLLLLGSTLMAMAVSAQVAPQRVAALAQYKQDLLSVLSLRGDSSHLLGAALLARSLDDSDQNDQARHLLHRAAQGDPDNPVISWVQLNDCDQQAGNCPSQEALENLKQQAPDNAAVWLLVLAKAHANGDQQAAHQALTQAVAATRYDDYSGPILKALVQATTALPVSAATLHAFAGHADSQAGPASVQAFLAYSEAAVQPRGNFLVLMQFCDPKQNDTAQQNAGICRHLARTLVWATSPRARAAGLHLQEVLARSDQERQQASEEMRNLVWQVQRFSQLRLAAFADQKLAVQLLHLGQNGGSRMSRMAAMLHHAGIPMQAPSDFRPSEPSTETVDHAASAAHAEPAEKPEPLHKPIRWPHDR